MMAILHYLAESRDTLQAAIDDPAFCLATDGIVDVIATAFADGRPARSAAQPARRAPAVRRTPRRGFMRVARAFPNRLFTAEAIAL
jgi:hypothetical protein